MYIIGSKLHTRLIEQMYSVMYVTSIPNKPSM